MNARTHNSVPSLDREDWRGLASTDAEAASTVGSVFGTDPPSGGDPVLRADSPLSLECFDRTLKAEEVTRFDRSLRDAIDRMLDLMRSNRYVALSGPMVGLPLRVVAVDLAGSGQSQIVLINPVVEQVSTERQKDREGCLVVPDIVAHVERPVSMVVSALSRTGQPVRLQVGGILARILQHHIDHLEGRTFFEHVGPQDRRRDDAMDTAHAVS
ncbi:MAG: peptide deformylase [Gemmatimonadota bacterium]